MKYFICGCILFLCYNISAQNQIEADVTMPLGYVRDIGVNNMTPNFKSHNGVFWDLTLFPKKSKRIGFLVAAGYSYLKENTIFNIPENIYMYDHLEMETRSNSIKLFFGLKLQNRLIDRYISTHLSVFSGWYFKIHDYIFRDVDSQVQYFEGYLGNYSNNHFVVGSSLGLDINLSKYFQDKKDKTPNGAFFLGLAVDYFTTTKKVNYMNDYSIHDITSYDDIVISENDKTIHYQSETLPIHKFRTMENSLLQVLGLRLTFRVKFSSGSKS